EIDNRECRASLLSEVDQSVGLGLLHQGRDRPGIAQVHLAPADRPAGQPVPEVDALLHRLERDQALGATLAVPSPAHQAVDADNVVPGLGQVKRGRPAEVAVHPKHNDGLFAHAASRMLALKDENSMIANTKTGSRQAYSPSS